MQWNIIAKWEYTHPITTPNKVTSIFSYTVNMSKHSKTYVRNHLYIQKGHFCAAVILWFLSLKVMCITPIQPPCIGNTKIDKCAVNKTTMHVSSNMQPFTLKSNPTIVQLRTLGLSLLCSNFYLLFLSEFPQKFSHYSFISPVSNLLFP